jgi:hypothetical protein
VAVVRVVTLAVAVAAAVVGSGGSGGGGIRSSTMSLTTLILCQIVLKCMI